MRSVLTVCLEKPGCYWFFTGKKPVCYWFVTETFLLLVSHRLKTCLLLVFSRVKNLHVTSFSLVKNLHVTGFSQVRGGLNNHTSSFRKWFISCCTTGYRNLSSILLVCKDYPSLFTAFTHMQCTLASLTGDHQTTPTAHPFSGNGKNTNCKCF